MTKQIKKTHDERKASILIVTSTGAFRVFASHFDFDEREVAAGGWGGWGTVYECLVVTERYVKPQDRETRQIGSWDYSCFPNERFFHKGDVFYVGQKELAEICEDPYDFDACVEKLSCHKEIERKRA